MRRHLIGLTMAAAVALALWSPAAAAGSQPGRFRLVGDAWKLTALTPAHGAKQMPKNPLAYTIRLAPDGKLTLTADCNSGGGEWTRSGDTVTFAKLLTTLMGCPEGSLGSQFGQMLDGAHTVAWDDGNLTLTGADGGALAFAPALTGVIWRWQPSGGSSATPAIWAGIYSVAFDENGAMAVAADCNRGKSSYLTNGGALAIRGIALTRAACPEGTLIDRFVTGLESATAYTVSGGRLEITTGHETWLFAPAPLAAATPSS